MSPAKASAKQLLEWSRSYWGIENGLHYRRDVTLGEDNTRMSSSALAETMAAINNFVVGLVCKPGFRNLASAQRMFEAKIAIALASYNRLWKNREVTTGYFNTCPRARWSW